MTIRSWTGREARLLREALRLSQREFAATLGIAPRTVAQWDRMGAKITPRPEFQRMLDVTLQRAPDDAVHRFERAANRAADASVPPTPAHLASVGGSLPALDDVFPAAESAVATVIDLWRNDLLDVAQSMKASVEPAAWDEGSLRWLVAPPDRLPPREAGAVRVGLPDVQAVKQTLAAASAWPFSRTPTRAPGHSCARPGPASAPPTKLPLPRSTPPVRRTRWAWAGAT